MTSRQPVSPRVGIRESRKRNAEVAYLRVAKRAAIMVGRYIRAHQFKRARRKLKFLPTRLGRIIRDIPRFCAMGLTATPP
jgi:IS5 family transposase